jgi:mannosyl-oligosaccharide alpha-1,2-mannosidase
MYAVAETGLTPDIAWFNVRDEDLEPEPGQRTTCATKENLSSWKPDHIIKPLDAHNLQRPETVKSLFIMWRIKQDPIYREWGWKNFQAFEKRTKLGDVGGHTSLDDLAKTLPPTHETTWRASGWYVQRRNSNLLLQSLRSGSKRITPYLLLRVPLV